MSATAPVSLQASRTVSRPGTAASGPPSQVLTTADIVPAQILPVRRLLAVQLCIVATIALAREAGINGWYGAAAGLCLATALQVRCRGWTLPRWITMRASFFREQRKRRRGVSIADPFDFEMGDGLLIGFRWDGTTLISMLRIDANPQAMTILQPGMTVSGETVSVQLVAGCLRQFDITLDSIDVISQGARSQGHSRIAAVYDAVLGPLPAIAQRNVWLVVRFDPSLCAEAVRHRGGGRAGTLRAASTATRRVANRLTEAGLRTRILTSREIAQATNQLSDGVSLRNVAETWETCHDGRFHLRSFALAPELLTTAALGRLWTIPSYSTTVCISLRRDDTHDVVKIRGLARLDSLGRNRIELPGLNHLRGQQFSALVSSLPVAPPRRPVENWAFGFGATPFEDLALPASGCGQVVGADGEGRAVALPLFGPQVELVEVCGTLHLVQQVVLRSLALGARVRVHSRRPAAWRDMFEQVADQDLLWVTDFNRGAIQAGSERNYSVEVFDGVADHTVRAGVTAIVVLPPGAASSPHSDAVLEQLDPTNDTVRVSTRAGSAVVTMVATADEMRYIKASFDVENSHPG